MSGSSIAVTVNALRLRSPFRIKAEKAELALRPQAETA
jgi:hypothetical protein